MTDKNLLELRKARKAKKPAFNRQDGYNVKCVKTTSWRKPKGLQSKMRLSIRGKPATVSPGYRSPVAVRGIHQSGVEIVTVNNKTELNNVDPKIQGIVIGSTVGAKKRVEFINTAKEKNIPILNIKSTDNYIKQLEEQRAEHKKMIDARRETKKKKAAAETKEQPKELKEKVETEEKKVTEKKELDKVLTKRD